MTSFFDYAIDSIKKRKELRFLVATQVSITFLAYYLIVVSDAVVTSLFVSDLTSLLNSTLINYFGAFFIIVTVLGIIFTLGLVLFIIRLIYFYQTKEIAIMMGIGGLIEKIQNYFLVQLVLICLISNIIALIVAYFGSIVTLILVTSLFPNVPNFHLIFPDYQVLIVFIAIFFISYIISARLIMHTTKRYQDTLVSDEIDFSTGKENNLLARIFVIKRAKKGFLDIVTKITRLNIMRKSFVFILSLITTILFVFFIITLVFGTFMISDSIATSMFVGTGGFSSSI